MLKKQFAIFAFLVFFLAQFGKVINFSLCAMTAYEQTGTLACDCEKQLYIAVKTDNAGKNQSPQTVSSQQSSEELFQQVCFSFLSVQPILCFTAWPKTSAESLYNHFGNGVFHPPLQLPSISTD
jgi:hypothetical protein